MVVGEIFHCSEEQTGDLRQQTDGHAPGQALAGEVEDTSTGSELHWQILGVIPHSYSHELKRRDFSGMVTIKDSGSVSSLFLLARVFPHWVNNTLFLFLEFIL